MKQGLFCGRLMVRLRKSMLFVGVEDLQGKEMSV
jgi:hypothetical protein